MSKRQRPKSEEFDPGRLELRKPENFDLEKGFAMAKRLIKENKEFFKEMATK